MKTFGQLDLDGKVINAVVLDAEKNTPIEWLENRLGGTWMELIGGASIGYTYDSQNNVFIKPKPFNSWVLDENFVWQAPIEKPDDGKEYFWDEDLIAWVEVDKETE